MPPAPRHPIPVKRVLIQTFFPKNCPFGLVIIALDTSVGRPAWREVSSGSHWPPEIVCYAGAVLLLPVKRVLILTFFVAAPNPPHCCHEIPALPERPKTHNCVVSLNSQRTTFRGHCHFTQFSEDKTSQMSCNIIPNIKGSKPQKCLATFHTILRANTS